MQIVSIDFNISSVLVFFLIANGVFVSVLLLIKRDNKKANQYLSLLSFLLTLWLLDTFFGVADIYGKNPNLYFLPIYYSFAFGPLLYCYTLQITHTKKLSLKEKFIHFIPAILQGSLYVFLQLSSYQFRLYFWLEIHRPYTYVIELAVSFLSLLTYIYFSRKHLLKYKFIIENNYSNLHKITLQWLRQLHWVLFLVSLFWFFETIARVVWNLYPSTPLSSIMMGVIIILIAVGGLLQSDLKMINNEFETIEQPQQIALNDTELLQLAIIKDKMVNEQLFLQPELTLKDFANYVQLSPRETSKLINQGLHQSFIDFVNHFRVLHFKLLVNQVDMKKMSLLGVALDCGFNSKATFNRVFKKMEGKSPSEFINESQNMN